MRLFKQVLYDIGEQPLVSWIGVGGTALAIFLVMVVYMLNGITGVEAAPELNRSRMYYGAGFHVSHDKGDASSSLSYEYAREIYANLPGIENVSYTTSWNNPKDFQYGNKEAVSARVMGTDNKFWEIYDFEFSEGQGFDKSDFESGLRKVVITRALADRFFSKGEEVVGKTVMLDMVPYTIAGVVDNVNPLLEQTYAQVFYPFTATGADKSNKGDMPFFGAIKAHLLSKPDVDENKLRAEVERRYKVINTRLKKDKMEAIYHMQPYSARIMAEGDFGTNTTPDIGGTRTRDIIVYLMLLLLPAINLSTMTRSRMRRRISEIGLRRAFGARKIDIIGQMLAENMVVTLAGGIIGLILSLVFAATASQYFAIMVSQWDMDTIQMSTAPTLSMLFNWTTFLFAILFCLILNLMSAGIPAWIASRENPALALSSRGK